MRLSVFIIIGLILAPSLQSQELPPQQRPAAQSLAAGLRAYDSLQPVKALEHFEAALTADSANYEASWRAAKVAVELATYEGEEEGPEVARIFEAIQYASRAATIDPSKREGHALVAIATGMRVMAGAVEMDSTADPTAELDMDKIFTSFAAGVLESVAAAKRAIAIDSTYDLPHRMLGIWYISIPGLLEQFPDDAAALVSPIVEGFATGADSATAIDNMRTAGVMHMERAVALGPSSIVNHLGLAQVYLERSRPADARPPLEKIETLPAVTVNDAKHKATAKNLLANLPVTP